MAVRLNPLSTSKGQKYLCELCGKVATLACQHCRVTYYCSREHQSVDWFGIHEKVCQLLGALRTLRSTLGSEDERQRRQLTVQMSQHALIDLCKNEAQKHLVHGQYELAIPGALQSLRFSMEVYGAGRIELVPAYLLLAEANLGLRRLRVAEEFLLYANWSVLKNPECSHEIKSQLCRNFGKLYACQKRYQDALTQLAHDVYYTSLASGPEHVDTAGGYFYMADVWMMLNELENALAFFDKVVDIWYKFLVNLRHRPHESISDYLSEAHIAEALEMLRTVLETRRHHLGGDHIATGETAYALGILSHLTGREGEAKHYYHTAHAVYAAQLGADNDATRAIAAAAAGLATVEAAEPPLGAVPPAYQQRRLDDEPAAEDDADADTDAGAVDAGFDGGARGYGYNDNADASAGATGSARASQSASRRESGGGAGLMASMRPDAVVAALVGSKAAADSVAGADAAMAARAGAAVENAEVLIAEARRAEAAVAAENDNEDEHKAHQHHAHDHAHAHTHAHEHDYTHARDTADADEDEDGRDASHGARYDEADEERERREIAAADAADAADVSDAGADAGIDADAAPADSHAFAEAEAEAETEVQPSAVVDDDDETAGVARVAGIDAAAAIAAAAAAEEDDEPAMRSAPRSGTQSAARSPVAATAAAAVSSVAAGADSLPAAAASPTAAAASSAARTVSTAAVAAELASPRAVVNDDDDGEDDEAARPQVCGSAVAAAAAAAAKPAAMSKAPSAAVSPTASVAVPITQATEAAEAADEASAGEAEPEAEPPAVAEGATEAAAEAGDSADAPVSVRAASSGTAGAVFEGAAVEDDAAAPAEDDAPADESAELAAAEFAADAAAAAAAGPPPDAAEIERDLIAVARSTAEPIVTAALEAVFAAVAQELAAPAADDDAGAEPQTVFVARKSDVHALLSTAAHAVAALAAADAGSAENAEEARAAEEALASLPEGVAAADCAACVGALLAPPFERSLLLDTLAAAATAEAEAAERGEEEPAGAGVTLPELLALAAVETGLKHAYLGAFADATGEVPEAAFTPETRVPLAILQEHLTASEALALLLPYVGVDPDAVLEALGGSEADGVAPDEILDLLRG